MSLRKFEIAVDGKKYLVEVEEIGGTPVVAAPVAPVAAPAAPAAPAPVVEEAPAAPAAPVSAAGADAQISPMPGTILRILVNVGDTVSENQPVMILEAMKMENEIVASKSGTVAALHVSTGQAVNSGEPLITIN
jgi:biotin carboxyl carrier protein